MFTNDSKLILCILAFVFLAPFLNGLIGGIGGIIITILLFPFLAVFYLGVAAIGMFISGLSCIGSGVSLLFGNMATGFLTIGIGCLLIALGILAFLFLLYLCSQWLPRLIAWVRRLIGRFKGKDAYEMEGEEP